MTDPLVLLVHQRILPGGQFAHKLQDNGYRVLSIQDADQLHEMCLSEKPLLVVVDLALNTTSIRQAIAALQLDPATQHIPTIAYAPAQNQELLEREGTPGATLIVNDGALLVHWQQLIDQALQID